MARRGIQPVWVHVVNRSTRPYRLQFVALDPNHFSPLEAAALNRYSGGKRLLSYGLLAWLFVPLLILLPIKLLAVRRTNRKMDAFLLEHAFRMRPVPASGEQTGSYSPTYRKGTRSFSSGCLTRRARKTSSSRCRSKGSAPTTFGASSMPFTPPRT